MATISDFANIAAATAAGYRLQSWKGIDGAARVVLDLPTVNAFQSGGLLVAFGEDASNMSTAKTRALNALNAQRKHKYAGAPGAADGATVISVPHGETHQKDKT